LRKHEVRTVEILGVYVAIVLCFRMFSSASNSSTPLEQTGTGECLDGPVQEWQLSRVWEITCGVGGCQKCFGSVYLDLKPGALWRKEIFHDLTRTLKLLYPFVALIPRVNWSADTSSSE
jgi:hypothetical protein